MMIGMAHLLVINVDEKLKDIKRLLELEREMKRKRK